MTAERLNCVIHCLMDPLLCGQGLESCLKGPDSYNSQVLIEAMVIALTKLQPLLNKVDRHQIGSDNWIRKNNDVVLYYYKLGIYIYRYF